MAGTFSQIYIQVVFAVKGRENLIGKKWKDELNKYIAGIIKGKGQKPIIVNGVSDHIHDRSVRSYTCFYRLETCYGNFGFGKGY